MVALSVIVIVLILILNIVLGVNLIDAGKQLKNNALKNAGVIWLVIIAICFTLALVFVITLKNQTSEQKKQLKYYDNRY